MKRNLTSLIICAVFLCAAFSCRKDPNAGNGCISRVFYNDWPVYDISYQLPSMQALFVNNNLDTSQYVFWWDPSYYSFPGTGQPDQTVIGVIPLYNKLPALNFYDNFFFTDGVVVKSVIYPGAPESDKGDVAIQQSLSSLQSKFLKNVAGVKVYNNSSDTAVATYPYTRGEFKDTCLRAALGYLDAAEVPGSGVPVKTVFVKVWQVTPLVGNLPTVYVLDETGQAWGRDIIYP